MPTYKCEACGKRMRSGLVEFKDGAVCSGCFALSGLPRPGHGISYHHDSASRAIEAIERKKKKEALLERQKEMAVFNQNKTIVFGYGFVEHDYIRFYPNQGRIQIREKKQSVDYLIANILAFEVLENGHSLTKGGLGMAAAGGLLFGGAGAIVGAVVAGKKTKEVVSSLQLKLTIRDPLNPIRYIDFITYDTRKDSNSFKVSFEQISEAVGTLTVMIDEYERAMAQRAQEQQRDRDRLVQSNGLNLVADELIKLKSLLDQKVITKDEFIRQKTKLLE